MLLLKRRLGYQNAIEKCNLEGQDNCKKEFLYAITRKKKLIPVVMEKAVKDTSRWIGPVGLVGALVLRCKFCTHSVAPDPAISRAESRQQSLHGYDDGLEDYGERESACGVDSCVRASCRSM